MPQTDIGVLLFIGAIFFLIGLLGGGFEISAIKIPPVGKYPRYFSLGIGIFFMGIAVVRLLFPPAPSQADVTPIATTPAATMVVAGVKPTESVQQQKPTNTPQPTNTPRPTPAPTATIDADPTVYDNFNNPANDGSFNQSQWQISSPPPNQIIQQDGILIVTNDGKSNSDTRLTARRYGHAIVKTPTFFEAKLKLDPTKNAGLVLLVIDYRFSAVDGYAACRIDEIADAYCEYIEYGSDLEKKYETEYRSVDDGQFHTFRIDADPTKITFTFYLDGQVLGSYTPAKTDKYNREKAVFSPSIMVANWGWDSTAPAVGYFDDIRIGPIKE